MTNYHTDEWLGKKFGRLTVTGFERVRLKNGDPQWRWIVKCDCGKEKSVFPYYLVKGKVVSCGCYREHGEQNKPDPNARTTARIYRLWSAMISRCDPDKHGSKYYGKRGIRVCDEWKTYENFKTWAYANGYSEGLSIERIDINKNYEPSNCKWIERKFQARNTSKTRYVEYQGRRMSFAEACEIAGLPYYVVHNRMRKNNWPLDKALSIPLNATRCWKRNERFARGEERVDRKDD